MYMNNVVSTAISHGANNCWGRRELNNIFFLYSFHKSI